MHIANSSRVAAEHSAAVMRIALGPGLMTSSWFLYPKNATSAKPGDVP
jgi:hypothetical protein